MKTAKYNFGIAINTDDKTGEILAVYFRVRKGTASEVHERSNGAAFVNYDRHGNLLGIELLEPCSLRVLDNIANGEPTRARSQVRRFFRDAIPRQMVNA